MKKIFALLLLLTICINAQTMNPGEARGLFLGVGVGPRLPIGEFTRTNAWGPGFNFELSFTNSKYVPFFAFFRAGWEHFPGYQNYYKRSDYSSISTNVIPFQIGFKHYFKPLVNDMIILLPTAEIAFTYAYIETSHQFKIDSGRRNYVDETSKLGGQAGFGISMFLLEVMAYYNYLPDMQYFSMDLKIRIPIYMNF